MRDAARVLGQADQETQYLVVREFIVGRQQRVGLRLPLNLLHLNQAFIAVARGCPGRVYRPAQAVHVDGIHPAIGQVGIVGNRQQFVARLALGVHPLPQILGVPGIQRRVRHLRYLRTVAEINIAVQVAEIELGGVLVGAESGELAGLVLLVGDLHILLPDGAGHLRAHKSLDRRLADQRHQIVEHLLDIRRIVGILQNQWLRLRHLAERGAGGIRHLGDAYILRVVGDSHPVQRLLYLDLVAERVLDGFALGVFERLLGAGQVVAKEPGVHRPAGVDMLLAEIDVALRVRFPCQRPHTYRYRHHHRDSPGNVFYIHCEHGFLSSHDPLCS